MEPRSDVDKMLGIAPYQDNDRDAFPALMQIERQLTEHRVLDATPRTTLWGATHWGASWIDYEVHVFDCCSKCGTTEHLHYAHGLCDRCYRARRYREAKAAAWEGRAA